MHLGVLVEHKDLHRCLSGVVVPSLVWVEGDGPSQAVELDHIYVKFVQDLIFSFKSARIHDS